MKITIDLKGTQTETHCSITSSINACEKLSAVADRCNLFRCKLEYDFDQHTYKRCQQCLGV